MNKQVLALGISAFALIAAVPAMAEDLTLKRVMLSTGGVGYFEYEATVTGDADLMVDVPVDQIDDVMKSIVVYDDEGGVGSISLPGREPLREAFRSIPFGPEALDSPTALLNALRGAEITVSGGREMTGRILSVVTEYVSDGNGNQTTQTRVSLLTGAGVRQFILEDVDNLTFADPAIQADIERALAAVSGKETGEHRELAVHTTGEGERTVRVAYVVEAPLWKTSYRLTVPSDPGIGTAALQGWAILENMSGEDWTDVDLTVVSGNPVTFRQALYDSYYVNRQMVPVEVMGRVMPGIDRRARGLTDFETPAAEPMAVMRDQDTYMLGGTVEAIVNQSAFQPATLVAAESSETTTQVVFHVPEPVTVARGESLLVPVVDRTVKADLVALFQAGIQPEYPLAAVRLVNDGETGLPPGVLTLYQRDAGGLVSHVGDARLGALPGGESRLLSFAVDQKVTVETTTTGDQTITQVKIVDGLLTLTTTQRSSFTYTINGAAREDRVVLVDIPRYDGWTLVAPAAGPDVEIVAGSYRIRRPVAAGTVETVTLVQEQPTDQTIDLADIDESTIRWYVSDPDLPKEVVDAFATLSQRLGAISDAQWAITDLEQKLSTVQIDQGRLRENLHAVPETSDLYQRYLTKLDAAETEIETLQADLAAARATLIELRVDFTSTARAVNYLQ